MKNRFFYEYTGRIFLKTDSQLKAESIIADVDLDDFLINEHLYIIDDDYVSPDIDVRKSQFGSVHHPLNDPEKYERYKLRKRRYNPIFQDYLEGRIDKKRLIEKFIKLGDDPVQIDDFPLSAEIQMVDLKSKKHKTARLVSVD